MKAILIETDTKTIKEVEFAGNLKDAYRLLDVGIVERVEIASSGAGPSDVEGVKTADHDVWVDEEGLFSGSAAKGMFGITGIYGYFELVGRGLVTGKSFNEDGEEGFGDATITLDELKAMVRWL